MLRTFAILLITFNIVLCRPQFVSVKDGKIGVNFGGYHAEAGLGALLTGNAAHGGLSASAGTPYGQKAAAGIGAATGGNSQGGAYASASAGGNVGASAGLGAVAGSDAGLGAEAHTGPLSASASGSGSTGFQVSKTVPVSSSAVVLQQTQTAAADYNGNTNNIYRYGGGIDGNVQTSYVKESHVQRIKPPKKKHSRVHGHAHVAQPSNQNEEIDTRFGVVQQSNNVNSEVVTEIVQKQAPSAKIEIRKEVEQIPITVPQKQQQQQQQQQQQEVEIIETPVVVKEKSNSASVSVSAGGGIVHENRGAPSSVIFTQPEYIEQPAYITYRKHFRPWRRLHHYRKQVVPVIYEQPQTVTYVEKAVIPPPQQVIVHKEVEATPVVQTKVVTKTKSVRPAVYYEPLPPPPPVNVGGGYTKTKTVSVGGGGGGYGAGAGAGAASGAFAGSFNSAGLFDSIFNIPIATLKAVNGLVNNVAGGVQASGGVAVSKSVGVSGGAGAY